MTATEELRRLLDERGVEWRKAPHYSSESKDEETIYTVDGFEWYAHEFGEGYLQLRTAKLIITPEQAIAATLGTGTCHDKGNIERFICSECGCRLDLQDDDWEATMWLADGAAMVPRYCPNCGRRVVA